MRLHSPRGWLLLLAGTLALPGPVAPADEAILRDGRRLRGQLRLEDQRWRFLPAGASEPVSPASLSQVRLEPAALPPLRAGAVHRVTLRDGQSLTAGLVDLDGKSLTLRTAWADKVSLPRSAVASVTQLPGWALAHLDDFEDGLQGWRVEGSPVLGGPRTSGRKALVLTAPGQATEHTLAAPVAEGRAGINVHDTNETTGATWMVEAEFRTPGGPRTVSVVVAGAVGHCEARVPGLEGVTGRVPRSAGWHRLVVQFTKTSLRVVLDEAVLWYSLKQGPGGPLVRWRMACRRTEGPQPPRGRVAFDEFAVHRSADELRRPAPEPGQDEVWLLDGDQLFGRVVRADGRSLTLEGRFGRRNLPWSAVRGIFPRQERRPAEPPRDDRVRLHVENGYPQPDELEGTVLLLDARRCRLRHALLGDLELERGRIARVLWDSP
jgi:hypothetical protein